MSITKTGIQNTNLPLIHAIRGVAAFYVVVFHAKFILWSGGRDFLQEFPRNTWNILDYLNFGITLLFNSGLQMVMIFFVLSGFFIAMSLDKTYVSFSQKLKNFYSVRAVRIYAPYLASIMIAVIVLYFVKIFSPNLYQLNTHREFNNRLITAYHDLTVSNFLKSLIFLYDKEYIGFNVVYWSLLHEAIFYLIVPFVQFFRKQYLATSFVLFLAGMVLFSIFEISNPLVIFFFQYNFYFAIGQAIYFYRNEITAFVSSKDCKKLLLVSSLLLFLIFDLLALMKLTFWANFLSAITGSLLLILFLNYDIKNNYLIRSIKHLGKISYSLYLAHLPTIFLVYTLIYHFTGKVVLYGFEYLIGIIVSLFTGSLLYKAAEEPSLILIKRIKKLLGKKLQEPATSQPSSHQYPTGGV